VHIDEACIVQSEAEKFSLQPYLPEPQAPKAMDDSMGVLQGFDWPNSPWNEILGFFSAASLQQ